MKRAVVDGGGFFALRVRDDRHHAQAAALFQLADDERWALVTTNVVIIEAYSLFLARSRGGPRDAVKFLDALRDTRCRIERIRPRDEERAIALVRAHEDKSYSLCDALSFVVMERLGIKEAIAFDRHFSEYGRFTIP
ncbi:MAG: type II toxin-antitoxin system VapC family toxin [Deltaproteobacteria bacterium]|nr:type II toxin-antitoxin system VapC family toxin [Deltaproteobacteria bacterium]